MTPLFWRKFVVVAVAAVTMVVFSVRLAQLDLEDALFLTRNSLRELKQSYLPIKSLDLEYPINNMMNLVFPIDLVISLNHSTHHNVLEVSFAGRYASFSPIINDALYGHYRIFPTLACDPVNATDHRELHDHVLVVLRGGCTFVEKVESVLRLDLHPRAIIIANNEPFRGLVTMYSSTFNEDGLLQVPIMFITYEDYQFLNTVDGEYPVLRLSTAPIDKWMSVLVSMTVSPPILILIFYLVVRCIQQFRKARINKINERLVKNLPVYIFNNNHLIHTKRFKQYLKHTCQDVPAPPLASSSLRPTPRSSIESMSDYIVNGCNVQTHDGVLTAPHDFYLTFKCSICLDQFEPLRSRVLLLDCKHIYHEKCLTNWLVNFRRSCPLCNKVLRGNDLQQILNHSISYGTIDLEEAALSQSAPHTPELNITGAPSEPPRLSPAPSLPLDPIDNPTPSPVDAAIDPATPTRPAPFRDPPSASALSEASFHTTFERPSQILSRYSRSSGFPLSTSIDLTLEASPFLTPSQSLEDLDTIDNVSMSENVSMSTYEQ